jgi:hypothetical protein
MKIFKIVIIDFEIIKRKIIMKIMVHNDFLVRNQFCWNLVVDVE